MRRIILFKRGFKRFSWLVTLRIVTLLEERNDFTCRELKYYTNLSKITTLQVALVPDSLVFIWGSMPIDSPYISCRRSSKISITFVSTWFSGSVMIACYFLFAHIDCTFPFSGDCKVPTLDETIEFALDNDLILLFDVKGGIFCSKVIHIPIITYCSDYLFVVRWFWLEIGLLELSRTPCSKWYKQLLFNVIFRRIHHLFCSHSNYLLYGINSAESIQT